MNFKAYKLQYTTQHKETLKNNEKLKEIRQQVLKIKEEVKEMTLDKEGRSILKPDSKSYFLDYVDELIKRLNYEKDNIIDICPHCKDEKEKVIIYNFEETAMCGKCISKILKERSSIVSKEKSESTSEN